MIYEERKAIMYFRQKCPHCTGNLVGETEHARISCLQCGRTLNAAQREQLGFPNERPGAPEDDAGLTGLIEQMIEDNRPSAGR